MSKKRRKLPKLTNTYTVMNELLASPTEPLPLEKRTYQLTRMYEGLRALEMDADPKPEDWRCVSDAVNLMETLVREMRVCDDSSGLLQDAVEVLKSFPKRDLGYADKTYQKELICKMEEQLAILRARAGKEV